MASGPVGIQNVSSSFWLKRNMLCASDLLEVVTKNGRSGINWSNKVSVYDNLFLDLSGMNLNYETITFVLEEFHLISNATDIFANIQSVYLPNNQIDAQTLDLMFSLYEKPFNCSQ